MNPISTHSLGSVAYDATRPANFTRRSKSLTSKFWRSGHWHLIPLYHVLRLSDLAREGIERSGSYRFADHLYQNRASGRWMIGRLLDRLLLSTNAARGMRERCTQSSRHIQQRLDSESAEVKLLAIPCGIPRDISRLRRRTHQLHYTGMDVDEKVLAAAKTHLEEEAAHLLPRAAFIHGDALCDQDFPSAAQDIVVSTGLGEFLNDDQLGLFFRNVFEALKPGGTFYTSATRREGRSDYLLNSFELRAHYRTEDELRAIFGSLPWQHVEYTHDATGLQTFVVATR